MKMIIIRHISAFVICFYTSLPLAADNADFQLGTLPILYINTDNSANIVSKEEYLNATWWLEDVAGGGGNLGSRESPLFLKIKGRGHATWRDSEKKPYRIKLSEKQALLGMKKNKHFVLLAGVDDNFYGFLKYPVGFELSRRIGLGWTPEIRQIELILNGDYRGLYFLTEKIRIDKDRINIIEQNDQEDDEDMVSGGWLLEFDNNEESNQVKLTEGKGANTKSLLVTYHSPEVLSDIQRSYLVDLLEKCNETIYTEDKSNNDWENYIDIETLAKFYIIHEVLGHQEAFMGSTYLYKERGENEKIKFGPIWDLGVWVYMGGGTIRFIYEDPPYDEQHWIAEIAKFPHFQEVVKDIWSSFKYKIDLEELERDVVIRLQTAAENNFKRWPNDRWTGSLEDGKNEFDKDMRKKIDFLNQHWGTTSSTSHIMIEDH